MPNEAAETISHLTDENCELKLKIAKLEKKLALYEDLPDPRVLSVDWPYVKRIFELWRDAANKSSLAIHYLGWLGKLIDPVLSRWQIEHNAIVDLVEKETMRNKETA